MAFAVGQKGEPMSDLIDRQTAIDALYAEMPRLNQVAMHILYRVPSAQPERKKGKWETEIRTIYGRKIPFFACSECGENAIDEYRFCPNCGAEMKWNN